MQGWLAVTPGKVGLAFSWALLSAGSASAVKPPIDPACAAILDVESGEILSQFRNLQDRTTYTPARARELHARVEDYLQKLGTQLKNFNVERFVEDGLDSLRIVDDLSEFDRAKLTEVLRPAFASRRVPSLKALRASLREAGLAELPAAKIRKIVDLSFRTWRTKLIFDTLGETVYNQLAKSFAERLRIGEFSMDVGTLGKNEWEAFLESEKGPAIFNPSMEGLLKDKFLAIEAHESVHMIVQTLAAQGRPSPYHVWIKLDPRYKKFGAIGKRQRDNLYQFREDPLSAGDFYRAGDLYVDEIPAHIVEAAYLDARINKVLQREFSEFLDTSVRGEKLRDEVEDLYSEYRRLGADSIEWDEYSAAARKALDRFLDKDPSDLGRTGIGVMTRGLGDYMNWVDILNDNIQTAVADARKVVTDLVEEARIARRKGLHPTEGGPISIRDDVFLGKKGYLIEVKIPVDVLKSDGTWRRQEMGGSVKFRFTQQGATTQSITPQKLERLFAQMDWTLELNRAVAHEVSQYAKMVKDGRLRSPTVRDILLLKRKQSDLREIVRKVMGEIREGR